MQRLVRTILSGTMVLGMFSVVGCATVVPRELADARTAYQHASASRASDLSPAELHKAKEALVKAEEAWSNDAESAQTRDLSYVAQRKAQLAEAMAGMALAKNDKTAADQSINKSEHTIAKRTAGELTQTREQLAESQRNSAKDQQALGTEREARMEADKRTAEADARAKSAQDALAKLAAVKEEERGMVITLNGSVLFPSDQSTLLPEAQTRLNQVADALMATKERNIVVEGHTDSRGSESHNIDLSQRRAESVRSYLVTRGYEADRVQAHGIGKGRPTTSNDSAEGRANNRRVEIIVQPIKK
ncbi:MAG: Flagellar motor rotation protein MotB [Myxococcales bacterium]|nr:Flagellar motor rotation protein MotB [Myxococcales bacterium]